MWSQEEISLKFSKAEGNVKPSQSGHSQSSMWTHDASAAPSEPESSH